MATEISSVLRAWANVRGPIPPTGVGYAWKGDGVASVARTNLGVFLLTLSFDFDPSESLMVGAIRPAENPQLPPFVETEYLMVAPVGPTNVRGVVVTCFQGIAGDVGALVDPEGFSFEMRIHNVEAVTRIVA